MRLTEPASSGTWSQPPAERQRSGRFLLSSAASTEQAVIKSVCAAVSMDSVIVLSAGREGGREGEKAEEGL